MADESPKVPTNDDIARLKRFARVALAARSARRVQPLFDLDWYEDVPVQHCRAINQAIAIAESIAASATVIHDAAKHAADAAYAANTFSQRNSNASPAAGNVAAVANAALYSSFPGHGSISAAALAVEVAAATFQIAAFSTGTGEEAIRRDYELLLTAQELGDWIDTTPVPPEFFGPLWPSGEPEGWPEAGLEPHLAGHQYKLTVTAPETIEDEEVNADVVELIALMDDLSRAMGDKGVRLNDDLDVHIKINSNTPSPTPVGC